MAVEFSLPTDGTNGVNNEPGNTKNRKGKAGAGKDELVEMRFYIPGTAVRQEQAEGDEKSVDGEEPEEQNAANLFYETLMDKAEIGEVAGDTFATFPDVLHLTPRYILCGCDCMFWSDTNKKQRTVRYRHVRELASSAW